MNITKKYHILLVGLAFLVFTLTILTDTYDFFVKEKFYEGFAVVGQVFIFDFFGLLLTIPFLFKKDFKNLGIVWLFYLTTTIVGFLGFKISLTLLPIILGFATIMTFRLVFKDDNKE